MPMKGPIKETAGSCANTCHRKRQQNAQSQKQISCAAGEKKNFSSSEALPRWDVEGPQELGAGSQLLFFYDGLRVSLTDSCSALDSFLLFFSTDTCVGSSVVVLVSEFLRASFVSTPPLFWKTPFQCFTVFWSPWPSQPPLPPQWVC